MQRRWLVSAGLVVCVLLAGGCDSSLKDQNALLMEENEGLRDQLASRNAALESVEADLRERDNRIAQLEGDLEANWAQGSDPFGGIEGVQGSVSAGEITATVASDVLFDPGKAVLKSRAKRSLDEVARVIRNDYSGHPVRVAGFTDTDPIRKSGHKSNYHLGFERAFSVRQYLIEQGVPSRQVYVSSFGPDRAKATKSESRRVEIAVVLNE